MDNAQMGGLFIRSMASKGIGASHQRSFDGHGCSSAKEPPLLWQQLLLPPFFSHPCKVVVLGAVVTGPPSLLCPVYAKSFSQIVLEDMIL